MKKNNFTPYLISSVLLCLFFVNSAQAYVVENLNFENEGDIVIGPGKTELMLDPGASYSREILVSNRSGMTKIFDITVEDFKGSDDPGATIQFLGGEKGPYSLKDYVKPEITQITLEHGQRLRLPISINVPQNAEPGGLYGAVMISASNIPDEEGAAKKDTASGKLKIITKVASLFFVRVSGDVKEEGVLKEIKTDKNFYEKGPVSMRILSENTGNVHLSPYGAIEIKNILGQVIDKVQVDPWFVMPQSKRTREIKWNSNFLFGKYTANLSLNRGYDNVIDQASYSFWVIPWRIILIIFIGLILVIWLFVWIASHFELKKKTE